MFGLKPFHVDLALVKIAFGISGLFFCLFSDSDEIEHGVIFGDAKQTADLFIGCLFLAHSIPNMYPEGAEAVLFGGKQDIRGGDGCVLYPELAAVEIDHDGNDSASAEDLAAALGLAFGQLVYVFLILYDDELDRPVTKGAGGGQGDLHDLIKDLRVDWISGVLAKRAVGCRQIKQLVFHGVILLVMKGVFYSILLYAIYMPWSIG